VRHALDVPTSSTTSNMIRDDVVCVVGIACRYPGESSGVEGFWDTIVNARSAQVEIPKDRFDPDTYYHPNHDRAGAIITRGGYFLREGISRFDAPFFSITTNEAASMDPQQRMLLEVAYETFENGKCIEVHGWRYELTHRIAGIPIDRLRGSRTGCYIGSFMNDYEASQNDIYDIHPYAATGHGRSMLANRLSWFYDLRGPSFVVDTACSSSMYAFHLAYQSIRLGESSMALVGGSNAIIAPSVLRTLSAMRFLSPTGRCHSYDQSADGYARGEGVGMLLLKRLSNAIADGDTIRAIVRASGLNQDGNTPGVTVPSATAQAALIRQCYEEAGLSMDETTYFEGHGTGTLLGDPIELQAIGATFGPTRTMANPLHVGSVKANVGHQEGGAGMAGIIRAILAIEKGIIPPTAELKTPNAAFRLQEWKISLPVTAKSFPADHVRRVSINSFGYGGANSHVILEDARSYLLDRHLPGKHSTTTYRTTFEDGGDADSGFYSAAATSELSSKAGNDSYQPAKYLFPFSGFDQAAVIRTIPDYVEFLKGAVHQVDISDIDLAHYMSNIAFTLAERRTIFTHRVACVAGSITELISQLESLGSLKTKKVARKPSVAFVFTGQGAQYRQMSKGLLSYSAFKTSLDQSNRVLASLGCEWDLIEEICRDEDDDVHEIDLPHISQPVCTAIQIALVELLAKFGVTPSATVGHSSGEIAAAWASHKLGRTDALRIAYFRGIYSSRVANRNDREAGAMLAVGLGVNEAERYLQPPRSAPPPVVIACINSPQSVTLSGNEDAILLIEQRLKLRDVFVRRLMTHRTAYHSHHMEYIAAEYLQSMMDIVPLHEPEYDVPMFSSVTGKLISNSTDLSATYWVENMLCPVKFSEAIHTMLHHTAGVRKRRRIALNHPSMLEIGPSCTLKGPINQILASLDINLAATSSYASVLKRGQDDAASVLAALAHLWVIGIPIAFSAVNEHLHVEHVPQVCVDLPAYQWNDCGKMWHETTMNREMSIKARTDLLGYRHNFRNMDAPVWRNIIRISEVPWLADHRVHTAILYPASSMIASCLEAAGSLAQPGRSVQGYEFREISILKALVLPPDGNKVEVQLRFWAHRDGTRTQQVSSYEFSFVSLNDQEKWDEHCHG
jgi:acyl transferase domain-containing protein